MSQSWSDFPVIGSAPDAGTHRWLEDNTWSLCLMWAAGPEWIVATPDRVTREPVIESTVGDDESIEYQEVPFSSEDQDDTDDVLDADLAVVGLPPRPRGYDWYLKLTPDQSRAFDSRYGHLVEEDLPSTVSTHQYLTHIYGRMSELVPTALKYAIDGGETSD